MAGDPSSAVGSGGMITKLIAARIALGAGCRMAIAPGKPLRPLRTMTEGGRCTWFLPRSGPMTARKRWIAGALKPIGTLIVDDGAHKALTQGCSLLPAGVRAVEGAFDRGDPVVVKNPAGRPIARGLSNYSADEARLIAGKQSGDIEAVLGYQRGEEMIHRDDLVVE